MATLRITVSSLSLLSPSVVKTGNDDVTSHLVLLEVVITIIA